MFNNPLNELNIAEDTRRDFYQVSFGIFTKSKSKSIFGKDIYTLIEVNKRVV